MKNNCNFTKREISYLDEVLDFTSSLIEPTVRE